MSTPNPYAAPKAQVADATSALAGDFVANGSARPAGNGWRWIADAWGLFRRQPGMWIGIVLVAFVIFFVLALIPFVGSLASFVLGPVFGAGFVLGCRALDQGEELEMAHLFAGFRNRFGTLVAVGLLYLAAWLAVVIVIVLATGMSAGVLLGTSGAEELAQASLGIVLAVLVGMALMIPVLMAVWFAPALVALNELGAIEAMKQSFVGCLKNVLPLLVYGLVLFVLAIFATIPLALGWLVLGPVLAGSLYTAYRDIYYG